MTDEQIINNVKCCVKQISNCSQCSYRFNEDDEFDCEEALGRDILVLINRQKAEIENQRQIIDEKNKEIFGLQKRIVFWREDLNYQPEKIKVEAIKEFAERLKKEICKNTYAGFDKKGNPVNIWEVKAGFKDIDNLFRRQGFIHKTSARTKFA